MSIISTRRILALCVAVVTVVASVGFAQSEQSSGTQTNPRTTKKIVHKHRTHRSSKHVAKRTKHTKRDTAESELRLHYPAPSSGGEEPNGDWYRKRAYPNEFIDPEAYPNALREAAALPQYRPAGIRTQSAMQWQPIGPFKIGGRVTSIATHPTDPNTFYVGGAAGGLWKTTDHGVSWRSLTDTFSAISVGCITIDPHDANTIYLGMGECNSSADSYPGNGLWRSTDAGETWTNLGLTKTQYISKVIVDPSDRNIVWVCIPGPGNTADSNRGVWKTVDFGATWVQSLLVRTAKNKLAPSVPVIDMAMNPSDRNDIVAATWQKVTSASSAVNVPNTGLWRTRDGGMTWNRIDTISGSGYINGITFKHASRSSLLWTTNTKGVPTLYALTSKVDKDPLTGYVLADNFNVLLRTTNPESGWQVVLDSSFRIPFLGNNIDSVDIFNRQGGYNNLLVANPHIPDDIYLGGIDILRSSDGGNTWKDISNAYPHYFANDRSQHSDMHALAFTAAVNGTDILNGQDGGVFNTTDFGQNWTQLKGLPITMFYHLEPWYGGMDHIADPFPVDSLKFFGGTQDNGTVSHGFSANADWDWINRGDGGMAQSDPNNPSHIVTSLQLGKIFFRTTLDSLRPNLFSDAGNLDPNAKKWFDLSVIAKRRGITDSSESCTFIPPVLLDKQNGRDVYTGKVYVYKSTLDFTDPDSGTVITRWSPQLAGSPGNPKTWYTGSIETMALGPRDSHGRPMLWAAGILGGARAVWRTTLNESLPLDSMPRWIRADSSGLLNLSPNWLEADRSDSLTAFIAFSGSGSGHLYKTSDGGKHWTKISGNLPNTSINAFVIDSLAEQGDPLKKNQCIFAATDVGVFVTTDGGTSWASIGTGMPHLVVGSLAMYRNWLVAGTHGRSAWALDVSSINAEQRSVRTEAGSVASFSVTAFPNPVRERCTVQLNGTTGPVRLTLFDLSGRAVLSTTTSSGSTELALPTTLSAGTYMLTATTSHGETAETKIEIAR